MRLVTFACHTGNSINLTVILSRSRIDIESMESESKKMLKQPREFIFIILKPSAANNIFLTKFITSELLKYGDIKYFRYPIFVNKQTISKHYEGYKSSFWYPFLINYFNNKSVACFILESKPNSKYPLVEALPPAHREGDSAFMVHGSWGRPPALVDKTEDDFAKFLKQEVIGPANIFKTKKFHIRRLALRNFSSFFLDNLIHSSDNTKEALSEIRIWYKDNPNVIEEFETKALALIKVNK